jgi:hypothetical protein
VKSEYKWVEEESGTEYTGKSYKSFKGKPIASFNRTAVVAKYDTVDLNDMHYAIENEKTYLVSCESLKHELKELSEKSNITGYTRKGISFKYCNRGLKLYRAYVFYNEKLDRLLMRCTRGDLRKVDLIESEKEEITADEGVEQLDMAEIEV